jgi:ABC-type polysaccharide/polyol phosphate export permease
VQAVTFLSVLAVVAVVTIALRGAGASLVLLPVLLVALFAFVLGLSLLVSVTHAYFRDVAPILGAVLLPWFFLSPIFFTPDDITHREVARAALEWANPVAPFITAIRDVIWGGVWPSAGVVLYVAAAAALALAGGAALFRRMQAELAVVV